jgi:hypothetical protein
MKTLIITIVATLLFSGTSKAQEEDIKSSEPQTLDENKVVDDSENPIVADEDTLVLPPLSEDENAVTDNDGFELLWPGRDPYPNRPNRPPRYRHPGRPNHPPGRPYPPPYHYYTDYIECSSRGYNFADCWTGQYIRNAGVYQRHSRSACIYGYSWGISDYRIWVDHGCRATFWVEYY